MGINATAGRLTSVKCGHCHRTHPSRYDVKRCGQDIRQARQDAQDALDQAAAEAAYWADERYHSEALEAELAVERILEEGRQF